MADPRRLVPLSAIGRGRKIRRIRFCENAIFGDESNELIVRPLPESDDAGKGDVPACLQRSLSEGVRPCVAVEHSLDPRCSSLDHHRTGVILRVARVHDDRLRHLSRERELLGERTPLLDARRVVVVIIETAFTDCNCAIANEFPQRLDVATRIVATRIVRVNAGRAPDKSRIPGGDARRSASGAEDIPGAAP